MGTIGNVFDKFGAPILDELHVNSVKRARVVKTFDGFGGFTETPGVVEMIPCDPVLFRSDSETTLSVNIDADIEIGDLIFIDYEE